MVGRREMLVSKAVVPLVLSLFTQPESQPEYTNSLTASRHTNISPAEAYDVIRQQIPRTKEGTALDVGAGAGVSTDLLYQLGYTASLDAIDWNADAWNQNVIADKLPPNVHFYELDDESFFRRSSHSPSYDVIVYNFAINLSKAVSVAKQYLKRPTNDSEQSSSPSLLLAPVNEKADYWYKQYYVVLNADGKIVWQSPDSVGAWSVQFQPDVTSSTCTGIWCGSFNGFLKQQ